MINPRGRRPQHLGRVLANLDADIGRRTNQDVDEDRVLGGCGGRGGGLAELSGVGGRAAGVAGRGGVDAVVVDEFLLGDLRGGGGVAVFVGVDPVGEHFAEAVVRHASHVTFGTGGETACAEGADVVTLAVVVPGDYLNQTID